MELDTNTATCIIGDICFVIHDNERPVILISYDPSIWYNHACIIDAAGGHNDLTTSQSKILLLNQVIHIKGLKIT